MFSQGIISANRLLQRPLLRDFSLPSLPAVGSRRFFQKSTRGPRRFRIRIPLAITISVCTVGTVGVVGLAIDKFGLLGRNSWHISWERAKSHLQNVRSSKTDEIVDDNSKLSTVDSPVSEPKLSDARLQEVQAERVHMRETFRRA